MVELRVEAPKQTNRSTVAIQVQLRPPPQTRLAEAAQRAPIEPTSTREDANTIPKPAAPALPPPRVDVPRRPDTLVTIEPAPAPLPAPEAPATTRLAIRQMVETLRSEQEQQAVLRACTPLQRLNPMLRCADEGSSAFDDAQRDVGAAFFATNPAFNQGNANAARVRRIADSLRNTGMSQGDIDRYVEGIDVNAQDRSTSGDARAGAVRDQMFRNDSTYQQMRRVLNP